MTSKAPAPPRAFATAGPQSRRSLLSIPFHAPHPSVLDRPVTIIPGVGPALARTAAKLGIHSLADLLEYRPFDHRDYERQRQVSELALGEEATVSVEVRS